MLSKIDRIVHGRLFNVVVAVLFSLFAGLGLAFGGTEFLAEWAGSVAAAICIFALIFKSQGYWTWSIVNAGLWFYLFFYLYHLPMVGMLQISYIIFAVYAFVMWATTMKFRIGYKRKKWADNLGTVISLAIFIVSVVAYLHMPGYAFTGWWWIEFFAVFISIASNWMDAFKFKGNWIGWTATNFLFGPLFFHSHLWGPFALTFVYQAFCIIGYLRWKREEKRLIQTGQVELGEGVITDAQPDEALARATTDEQIRQAGMDPAIIRVVTTDRVPPGTAYLVSVNDEGEISTVKAVGL